MILLHSLIVFMKEAFKEVKKDHANDPIEGFFTFLLLVFTGLLMSTIFIGTIIVLLIFATIPTIIVLLCICGLWFFYDRYEI